MEKNLQFVDLHLHSKYSRATSKNSDLEGLSMHGKTKGLSVLGTGDFQHPHWFKELKQKLVWKNGIYEYNGMKFIPSTEISLVYTQNGKGRRVHHVILAPDLEIAEQIQSWLSSKGRIDYDGRPIFGFGSIELVENMMSISNDIMIIPAHVLTPWFGLLGSMSGFDSVEECFQEKSKYIYALETGLSATPSMIHRVDSWSKYTLVSFSDSHSPFPNRIGRECCVFDLKNPTYESITDAIKTKKNFAETIEFFPEEGKYHFDGHRACNVSMSPLESNNIGKICPSCKKPMTIGVLNRVEELANRPEGYVPKNTVPFKSFIPLLESIGFVYGAGVVSKRVNDTYNMLIQKFGNELNILMNISEDDLKSVAKEKLADFIMRMRVGNVKFIAGYDGVYGKPLLEQVDKKETGLRSFVK